MTESLLDALMAEDDEKIAKFADRVLRVYGASQPTTLDREIQRIARTLNITLEGPYG